MRFCVIDKTTNMCINVVELNSFDEFIPYNSNTELAEDQTGEIGWIWEDNKWTNPNKIIITDEAMAQRVRNRRDVLLKKHVDRINAVRWNSYTEEQQQAWHNYRVSLLDIPQQEGFPHNVIWPTLPEN